MVRLSVLNRLRPPARLPVRQLHLWGGYATELGAGEPHRPKRTGGPAWCVSCAFQPVSETACCMLTYFCAGHHRQLFMRQQSSGLNADLGYNSHILRYTSVALPGGTILLPVRQAQQLHLPVPLPKAAGSGLWQVLMRWSVYLGVGQTETLSLCVHIWRRIEAQVGS